VLEFAVSDDARLRLFEESDAEALYGLIDRNRTYLARWLPWAETQTLEGTLAFIRATRRQLAENNGMQTALISQGQLCGVVGVHGISWAHSSTGIGFWLAEEFQGKGAMTAAVRAYTEYAFGTWGLNRMEPQAAIENRRSCAVAERLGFQREGVLREAETVGRQRHDVAVYAMLASQWHRSR
jgi:ribosomal-protein-serine acetyltransferase